MKVQGILRKMRAEHAAPIQYYMILGDNEVPLNDFLGNTITLSTSNKIFCIQCGRKTAKSFQQGHCYPCFQRIQECNNCILFPERCNVEKKGCPHDDWAHEHCHQKHVIYLANTSGMKVGITRVSQQPTRWIDQGAHQALPIFQVSNRYQSGLIEVAIKKHVSDRTDWRAMLKGAPESEDFFVWRKKLIELVKVEIDTILEHYDGAIVALEGAGGPLEFEYPVIEYPKKVSSLSLEKTPEISGKLMGIKGQYLLLDSGVLNLRKFGGYEVQFSG